MGIVIGIDQSGSVSSKNHNIGWAIFKDGDLDSCGELKPTPPHFKENRDWLRNAILEPFEKRVIVAGRQIGKHVDHDYIIDSMDAYISNVCVAIETVYLGKNPRVSFGLLSCKEHFHAVASDLGCQYVEITPIESAGAVGAKYTKGHRKEAVIKMVEMIFGLKDISEHVADAIAIAMAAENRIRIARLSK